MANLKQQITQSRAYFSKLKEGLYSSNLAVFRHSIFLLMLWVFGVFSLAFIVSMVILSGVFHLTAWINWLPLIFLFAVLAYFIGEKLGWTWLKRLSPHILVLDFIVLTLQIQVIFDNVPLASMFSIILLFLAGILVRPRYILIYAFITYLGIHYIGLFEGFSPERIVIMILCYFAFACIAVIYSYANNKIIERNEVQRRKIGKLYENDKQLYAELAHKLKTPLTALILATHKNESLNVNQPVEDLSRAVLQLTNAAKLNLSSIQEEPQTVNAREFFLDIVKYAETLSRDYTNDRPRARIQRGIRNVSKTDKMTLALGQVRECLLGVIDNGIRHNREVRNLVLDISLKKEEKYYVFKVEDNGKGIEKGLLKEIFTKSKEPVYGYEHLGLRIVKNTAEAQGGYLKITSKKGKGTLVEIYLPKSLKL